MPRVAFRLPKIGLVMESARVQRWLKRAGEQVRPGEALLEIETEKSTVEVESSEQGRLLEILLEEGAEAAVGAPLAWIEVATVDRAPDELAPAMAGPAILAAASAAPAAPGTSSVPPPGTASAEGAGGEALPPRIRSSPAARRLAGDHALALEHIEGSGPRGRVQLADVERALAERRPSNARSSAEGAAVAIDDAASLPRRGLTPMRRALARAMTLSNATIPQFRVERRVDLSVLWRARAALTEALPAEAARPSFTDFLLRALASALMAHPALNATFRGDPESPAAAIVPAQGSHVGLAVAVEDGLRVPVLHGIERSSIAEIAAHRSRLVARALAGTLRREELEGATLSLSNLGPSGPDRFEALIEPPQSAILAVGAARESLLVIDGEPRVRPTAQLTLTVDHRVADGRLAADFLNTVVQSLERAA